MTLRQYLIFMTVGTMLCWLAWFFVIWSIDPTDAGFLGFTFFYLSLFLALIGTISVGGFLWRRLFFADDEVVFRHVKKTFRHSLVVASAVIITLMLLALRWLRWWNMLLLLILFIFLELTIFTKRNYSNNGSYVQ